MILGTPKQILNLLFMCFKKPNNDIRAIIKQLELLIAFFKIIPKFYFSHDFSKRNGYYSSQIWTNYLNLARIFNSSRSFEEIKKLIWWM